MSQTLLNAFLRSFDPSIDNSNVKIAICIQLSSSISAENQYSLYLYQVYQYTCTHSPIMTECSEVSALKYEFSFLSPITDLIILNPILQAYASM